jgi:hypothetical protein
MSRHWLFLTAVGFFTAAIVFIGLWWAYGRLLRFSGPKSPAFRIRKSAFLRRIFSHDSPTNYELLRRYDEDRLEA